MAWWDENFDGGPPTDFAAGLVPPVKPRDPAETLGLFGYPVTPPQPPAPAPLPPPQAPAAPAPPAVDVSGFLPPTPPPVKPQKGQDEYIQKAQQTADLQAQAIAHGQAAQAARDQEIAAKQATAEAARANREREIEDQRTKVYADVDTRQKQIIDEATQLSQQQVDPARVYKNASTGAKIATVIAGAISGLINPKGGGQNVVDLVASIADKDAQAQVMNLQQKQRLLDVKQGALDKDFVRQNSLMDAQLRATLSTYDAAIRQAQAEGARWNNPIAAAKSQELIAGLQQKAADAIQKHKDEQTQLGLQRAQVGIAGGQLAETRKQNEFNRGMQAGQFARQLNEDISKAPLNAAETKLRLAEAQAKMGALKTPADASSSIGDPKAIHLVSNDKNGVVRAPTDKVSEEINKMAQTRAPIVDQINELQEINRELSGPKSLVPNFASSDRAVELRQRAESLWVSIANNVSLAQGQGQVKEGEWAVVKKQLGDPNGWYSAAPKLDAVRRNLVDGMNQAIEKGTGYRMAKKNEQGQYVVGKNQFIPWDPSPPKEADGVNGPPLPLDAGERRMAARNRALSGAATPDDVMGLFSGR